MSVMHSEIGRPRISQRMVLMILVIKHVKKLDDCTIKHSRKRVHAALCWFNPDYALE